MAHAGGTGPEPAAVDRSFAAHPDSVGQARRLVSGWLRAELPDADLLIGDVALAVSEACTNVVLHAYSGGPDGCFHLAAGWDGERIVVTISDGGGGMVPRPDSPGLGLGLPLIASLTDALEVRPGPGGTGTAVAMLFSDEGARSRLAAD